MRIAHFTHWASLAVLSACSGTAAHISVTDGGAAQGGGFTQIGGGANTLAGGQSAGSSVFTGGAQAAGGVSNASGAVAAGGSYVPPATGGSFPKATGGAQAAGGVTPTGGALATGGAPTTGGSRATGGNKAVGGTTTTGGISAAGGASTTGGTTSSSTSQGGGGVILYGTPYNNVNMWLGPVDYVESAFHNACGLEDGTHYPTSIQTLYGDYIIGLDGENIPNVESHCDDCAQLTANGKTIIAHVVTYGIENGIDAIDLSPQARTALGLSDNNWIGTWQFCACPTNGTAIYYEFDSRQWNPQNFWYMRIWTRNQHLPVTGLETKLGSSAWSKATQAGDGAWETQSGVDFSSGFQVRVTAVDNQQIIDAIPAPTGLDPAVPVAGKTNFQ